ncbi:MAG: hypothetical protein JNK05_27650 [Myxococcales bacterium]|nr:hypothetical protein [Myxococcales bacterium]
MRRIGSALLLLLVGCSRPPAPAARSHEAPRAIGGDGIVTASLETPSGALRVDDEGVLTLTESGQSRVLDRQVIPELSYSNALRAVVYPRRTALGSELVLRSLTDNVARAITTQQSSADRPAISPDGAWVAFWGSQHDATIVGLYVLELASGAVRRVNNRGVSIGGPGFVEPPIERSFRFDGARLVRWTGADGAHALDLASEGATP